MSNGYRSTLPGAFLVIAACLCARTAAADLSPAERFKSDVAPILVKHCHDCHADDVSKGNVTLDEPRLAQGLAADRELWWKVLKNVRAGLMPPAKKPRLTAE